MNPFSKLRALLSRARPKPLNQWYTVTFDDTRVLLRASPPRQQPWSQEFTWSSITRICFKAEDVYLSDGIYVFTTQRPESYVIPTEAAGGPELWSEILRRNLFDPQLAIDAATADTGLFCWPPPDHPRHPDK